MAKYGHNALLHYIDDLTYFCLSLSISQDIGLDIRDKKLCLSIYAWISYLIRLRELCLFLIKNYKKFVKCVTIVQIKDFNKE